MKTNKLLSFALSVAILSAAVMTSSCARLEVLSQRLSETVVKTNNEDDYSIKYTISVRNKGTAGRVRVKAKLFTPEGQFYREQIVDFTGGDEEDFVFIFTEPTFLGALFGEGKTRAEFSYEPVR